VSLKRSVLKKIVISYLKKERCSTPRRCGKGEEKRRTV
jgi:hypothetical protein